MAPLDRPYTTFCWSAIVTNLEMGKNPHCWG